MNRDLARRAALLLAPLLLVLAVGGLLIAVSGQLTQPACNKPSNLPDDLAMVVVCVGAFFFGHALVDKRFEGNDRHARGLRDAYEKDPERWKKPARRGALIAHLSVALVLLGGLGALAYETVGLWPGNRWGFDPITHYVRCAKGTGLGPTLLVAATVSFFAGHWLWRPGKRDGA